jgi:hypothetical protein
MEGTMLYGNKEIILDALLRQAGVPTKRVVATFTTGELVRISFIAKSPVLGRPIRTRNFTWSLLTRVLKRVPQNYGLENTWEALDSAWRISTS